MADGDDNPNSERDVDIALKRYDALMRYLAYENTTYWTRAQFFLVANAALIGFALKELPTTLKDVSTTRLVILFVCAVGGLLLTLLWIWGLKSGQGWINHWTKALRSLEPKALEGTKLDLFLVGRPKGVPSATRVARLTSWLFVFLWSATAIFLLVCYVFKARCINLP